MKQFIIAVSILLLASPYAAMPARPHIHSVVRSTNGNAIYRYVIPARTVYPPSLHCAAAENHQFDFWLGSWLVRNYARVLEGRNTVTREYGGCVVQEHFRSSDGSSFGSSFSFFDPSDVRWHYTWVDNIGAFELLTGGRIGSSMVMLGSVRSRSGGLARERMTWTPFPRGIVRQLWQASFDGTHWKTLSDVYYWRVKT